MFSVADKKKNSCDSQHPSIYLPLAPASKNKMLSLECNGSCYLYDIQKLPEWRYMLGRRTERDAICSNRPQSTFFFFFTKSVKCKVAFFLSPVLGSDCVAIFCGILPLCHEVTQEDLCVWQEGKLMTQVYIWVTVTAYAHRGCLTVVLCGDMKWIIHFYYI